MNFNRRGRWGVLATLALLCATFQSHCSESSCPPGSVSDGDICGTPAREGDASIDSAGSGGDGSARDADGSGGSSSTFDADAREASNRDTADDRVCNTPSACGASCVPCSVPEHGAATCSDGQCGFTCDKDFAVGGSRCVRTALYVSITGNDAWEGSEEKPLATFREAMVRAGELGSTIAVVNFEDGSYAEPGDDFSEAIPDGVSVRQKLNATGSVVFTAHPDKNSRLGFAGSGNLIAYRLHGIVLANFRTPLFANKGEQHIYGANIRSPKGPVEVTGTASLHCSACWLEADAALPPPHVSHVSVKEHGHLQLDNGSKLDFDALPPADCAVSAIGVENWGSLTLNGVAIHGRVGVGIGARIDAPLGVGTDAGRDSSNHIVLRSTAVQPECGTTSLQVQATFVKPGLLTVEIDDSQFSGAVEFIGVPKHVSVRNSTFEGWTGLGIRVTYPELFDLGTSHDGGQAGNNTFQPSGVGGTGLLVDTQEGILRASGNTWLPNLQGADANGRYQPGTMIKDEVGPNVTEVGGSEVEL